MTRWRVWHMSSHDSKPVPRYTVTSAYTRSGARSVVTEAAPWLTILGVQDASIPLPEQGGPIKPWETA